MSSAAVGQPAPMAAADGSASAPTPAHQPKHNKVCDFYLTRGCVKTDDCDYLHPKAPDGTITNKLSDRSLTATPTSPACASLHPLLTAVLLTVLCLLHSCEYYMHPRGCVKADECNFLHIPLQLMTSKFLEQHPLGGAAGGALLQPGPHKIQKACEFWQGGLCKKGVACEYLHPGFAAAFSAASAMASPAVLQAPPAVKGGVCVYFNSPQGCKKGLACDRLHATTFAPAASFPAAFPAAFHSSAPAYAASHAFSTRPPPPSSKTHPTRPVPCPYHAAGGCKKGADCEYVHLRPEPCQFYTQTGTCRKGMLCEFVHPVQAPAQRYAGVRGGGGAGRAARFSPY